MLAWEFALACATLVQEPAQLIDFQREVRPILSDKCFACHGPDAAAREAGLWLDTREGALADLGGYAAIAPSDLDASELVYRIAAEDKRELMPPPESGLGLTEAKAKEAGYDIKVGRFPFIGNGKAIALGEPEGMVKTVFDAKTGELLGAHMVGAEVTELIQGYVVGRQLETTEEDLMHTVFPHPTLSEMMHESVLDAWGRAIHF